MHLLKKVGQQENNYYFQTRMEFPKRIQLQWQNDVDGKLTVCVCGVGVLNCKYVLELEGKNLSKRSALTLIWIVF